MKGNSSLQSRSPSADSTKSTTAYRLLKSVPEDQWQRFNQLSPQGGIFSDLDFLRALGAPFETYAVMLGNEIKATFVVFPKGESAIGHVDYVPHHGIMFQPKHADQPEARAIADIHQITEFCVNEFFAKKTKVGLFFHPAQTDIRPFLWHNYHSPIESEKFQMSLRYTTYINLHQSESELLTQCSPLRRRLIRRSQEEGYSIRESLDLQTLGRLYKLTMPYLEQSQYETAIRVTEQLALRGKARMFLALDRKQNVGFTSVYLIDSKRAYYLFGSGDPDHRGDVAGTFVHWEAFRALKTSGVNEVDLVGVNSPSRGAFKMSFGGSLMPYYEIKLNRPQN